MDTDDDGEVYGSEEDDVPSLVGGYHSLGGGDALRFTSYSMSSSVIPAQ